MALLGRALRRHANLSAHDIKVGGFKSLIKIILAVCVASTTQHSMSAEETAVAILEIVVADCL